MGESRRDADLAKESLRAERCRELGAQHFDRDLAAVLRLLGEVDRRHAAGAELSLDGVTGGERAAWRYHARGHARNMCAWKRGFMYCETENRDVGRQIDPSRCARRVSHPRQ